MIRYLLVILMITLNQKFLQSLTDPSENSFYMKIRFYRIKLSLKLRSQSHQKGRMATWYVIRIGLLSIVWIDLAVVPLETEDH